MQPHSARPARTAQQQAEWPAADTAGSRFAQRFTLHLEPTEDPTLAEIAVGDLDFVRVTGASTVTVTPVPSLERFTLFFGSPSMATVMHSPAGTLELPRASPAETTTEVTISGDSPGEIILAVVPQHLLVRNVGMRIGQVDTPALPTIHSGDLLDPMAKFVDALFEMKPADGSASACLAEQMVHEMGAILLLHSPGNHAPDSLYRRAEQMITQCARKPGLTPEAIAQELGCSLRTLQRAFTERGTSVAKQIRHTRTQIALDLLEGAAPSTDTTGEIARAAGFTSSKTMHAALTSIDRTTP